MPFELSTEVVSERLGHSSIGITLDTYSHVMPGLQEAAANRIETSLRDVMSPPKGADEPPFPELR